MLGRETAWERRLRNERLQKKLMRRKKVFFVRGDKRTEVKRLRKRRNAVDGLKQLRKDKEEM